MVSLTDEVARLGSVSGAIAARGRSPRRAAVASRFARALAPCLCLGWLAVGCGGTRERPALPPPEYERPVLTPWDAPQQQGAWGDQGDALDDLDEDEDEPPPDEPEAADAGADG
ncbi:MAG: hypothetical protein KIT72_11855 [Polyangiaceae bacterium]|nr:hypothetical protein [Polyangiaceae bacterium]MCW5791108.1 hypothetical protein [Polyangiaceae bacterium]